MAIMPRGRVPVRRFSRVKGRYPYSVRYIYSRLCRGAAAGNIRVLCTWLIDLGSVPPADLLRSVPTIEADKEQVETVGSESNKYTTNLLPVGGSSSKRKASEQGAYVGEALPPVPQKLADRIQAWEFVEMSELLPEFWSQQRTDEKEGANRAGANRRKRPITEINVWLQCFAVYVGVMSAKHPEAIPELMAYMVAVIRACEDFSGLAWVRYDAAYRRQAAASGNRTWSRINPSLFSLCFTGKAQAAKRCDLCLAASHVTKDCSLSADLDPDLPSRLKAVESAVVAFAQSGSGGSERQLQRRPHDDICRVFNEKRCYFRRCRYRHVCLGCTGAHPLIDCPLKQNAGSVRPVSHQQQHPYLPPMQPPRQQNSWKYP